MKTLDRDFFFASVRDQLHRGTLLQAQVDGYAAILDGWAHPTDLPPEGLDDDRQLAYVLATAYHESAHTMAAIREFGEGQGKPYGAPDPETGERYYGRGLVQLTWKKNYAQMGDLLHVNLVRQPDIALDLAIAVRILIVGMALGLFTGRRLGHHFTDTRTDWIGARRIVNGLDRAELIAGYAKIMYGALSYRGGQS